MPVRKRSKGTWEIYLDTGRDPVTGKRLRHYETARGTKREAQQRLAELEVSIEKGSYIKPKRITVGEWLGNWLNGYVTTNCGIRTAQSYQSEVRRHLIPALGAIPLTQLQPQHLQNYYARALSEGRVDRKGGLSARTVQYHHRILSEALTHAVKMGLLVRNVAEVADPPHPERRNMATLSPEDIPQFLESARKTPYYVLFYTALYTGMRLGELLGLRWCDVDLDMASLSVVQALYKRSRVCKMGKPKSSHSRRQIALSPSLALILRQYKVEQQAQRILLGKPLINSDLVFSRVNGEPLDPGVVSHTFAKVLKKAGLPHIRFHDLRHTHATLLLKDGIHPKIVSERLGHASIAITLDTYSHVLPGLQERAAERFDNLIARENGGKMVAMGSSTDSVGR
jgi:integrase